MHTKKHINKHQNILKNTQTNPQQNTHTGKHIKAHFVFMHGCSYVRECALVVLKFFILFIILIFSDNNFQFSFFQCDFLLPLIIYHNYF